MPLPTSLVEKNGSKMRSKVLRSMPQPVSVDAQANGRPARASGCCSHVIGVNVQGGGGDDAAGRPWAWRRGH